MHFKTLFSPPIPLYHSQVHWDPLIENSEAFFPSNPFFIWRHFSSLSSLQSSGGCFPSVATSAMPSRGNRDKVLLEQLPRKRNPAPRPTSAKRGPGRQHVHSEAKGTAWGAANCLLSFLWGPEFATVIVLPEI